MKLVLAADHGAVELKDWIVEELKKSDYEISDIGTFGNDSVDYPDFALKAAKMVASEEAERGILFCGTGIGMSIAANKVKGILCAKVNSVEEGRLASEHNNANMLALGGRTTDRNVVLNAIIAWLNTSFGGDRHQRRIDKIIEAE